MTGKNANNGKGNTSRLLGGIEGGGTRFNCAIGSSPDEIWARNSFPTTVPEETFARVVEFFKEGEAEYGSLSAIGVASFGPVDLRQKSGYYGHITTTPKPHWRYTDVLGYLRRVWNIPMAFDTDVNGAARGEGAFGAARGLDNFVYVTVGTGIGAGIVAHGKPLNGAMHPEVGHMRLPRAAEDLHFPGCCQYHGDCLEGLASGPAIEARWGQRGETLPADHPAWAMQAEYLSMLCMNLTLCYAPERIILGGGVMARRQLLPMIRERFAALMNGYTELSAVSPQDYIVPPSLGERSGEVGALVAAERLAG